jgi:uncharacterized repeat protein (TIGR03803 family)
MNFKDSVLKKRRSLTSTLSWALRGTVAVLAVTLILMPNSWAAGREKVLHTFDIATAGFPVSGLAMDANGSLYGTTLRGGGGTCSEGCGVVFKLTKNDQGGLTYSILHSFVGFASDGGDPFGAPIVDSAGNVYGTTTLGGTGDCGVVYRLSPTAGGKYKETILHSFKKFSTRNDDGCNPESYLVSDAAGNLYGTTNTGGGGVSNTFCDNGCGSVFKLAPKGDGTYAESVIHSFPGTKGNTDGRNPVGGLVFDSAGNLWGSTQGGGNGNGTVFELTPNSDGTYTESTLFMFTGASTGFDPNTDLVIDKAGNLYGTATNGGLNNGNGVVFKVTPQPGGGVKESIIHTFSRCNATVCPDGVSPFNGLTIDSNGTLYGTVDLGGGASNQCGAPPAFGCGIVYKMTPNAQGKFTETILYRFQGFADGATPEDDRLVIDADGNIFGSTAEGGNSTACPSDGFGTPGGCGVVFEVTP